MRKKDKTLMMLIGDVHRQFGHKIREIEKKNGLGPCAGCVLHELSRTNELTQVELADKIHMRPSSISVALQKMEQDGLIEKRIKDDDQRCTIVYITEKGIKLNEEMRKNVFSMDEFYTKQLDQEELKIARNLIKKLSVLLEEEENENI